MKKYEQGDIVLIPYPYTDLSNVKQRPVVIISNNKVNHPNYIVAKITSVERNDAHTFSIDADDVENSLKKKSEVRANEVFTAYHTLIKKKVTKLKKAPLGRLIKKVKENF